MEVIFMHRRYVDHKTTPSVDAEDQQKQSSNGNDSTSNIEALPIQNPLQKLPNPSIQGLGQFRYDVRMGTKGLIIGVQAMMNGSAPIKTRMIVPLEPWTQLSFYYHPGLGRIQLYDSDSLSGSGFNAPEYYVGRIVVTDTDALVYLRGRIKDIPGFKNIIVKDEQSSGVAFTKYSSKVKRFMEETISRQEQLSRIDLHKQISYLEAQVDVLSKILIRSGIVDNPDYLELLKEADRFSMCETFDAKAIRKKMQYKKFVRGIDKVC